MGKRSGRAKSRGCDRVHRDLCDHLDLRGGIAALVQKHLQPLHDRDYREDTVENNQKLS